MAAVPKRKISTRRGGKRWQARLSERTKAVANQNPVKNKHLRSLSANK